VVAAGSAGEKESGGGNSPTLLRYQMGPASVKLIKANMHPSCADATAAVYGCFDTEFVISEVNADINLWLKDESVEGGWKLHGRFQTDPWGDAYNTIGLQISTKKKGSISIPCAVLFL
jgi:hypothetical protein